MGKLSSRTASIIACLLGPVLISAVIYLSTDVFFASLSLFCSSVVSYVIARNVLIEPEQAKLRTVATIFTTGFFCTATVALSQTSFAWQIATKLLQMYFPHVSLSAVSENDNVALLIAIAMLTATVLVAALVLNSRHSPAGTTRGASGLDARQLRIISLTLKDSLTNLDQELRFFDFQSAAVDPKLEKLSTTARFATTQTAFEVVSNAENSDFIVVKGEPGSGKSVMLRSLAHQLLERVKDGGKVPLLLNMRDLDLSARADQAEMVRSVGHWVKQEYRRQTGYRPQGLSDNEFDQLYREGSFIFLFDSFDENSAVGRSPHHGSFVGHLSHALVEFVRASGGCVGLVFSREYKSPSVGWIDHQTYVVKPFSDSDIRKYAYENCSSPSELIRAVFSSRPDLYAMAKSPLLLALVVDYCNANNGELPVSEFDVFESFIHSRIYRALDNLSLPHSMFDDVIASAKLLARAHSGIPAPTDGPIEESHVAVLKSARLLKRSASNDAFSHKRFLEYFRVRSMLDGEEAPPSIALSRIDQDRDILNLYAQICSKKRAKALARATHRLIHRSHTSYEETADVRDYEATVLGLRFLRNAFRNRPGLIDQYRESISGIAYSLWYHEDPLHRKHAAEQISLVPPSSATSLVRASLDSPYPFVRRVALSEARYVSSLQPWLGRCVAAYFTKQDDIGGLAQFVSGELRSAMVNAAPVDKVSFIADAVMRVTIILLILCLAYFEVPLLNIGTAIMLIGLYFSFTLFHSADELNFLLKFGLNPGLSGLLAINLITASMLNVGRSFVSSYPVFWKHGTFAWPAIAAIAIAVTMVLNNVVSRRRDDLDELGDVRSNDILRVGRPSMAALAAILREYWILPALIVLSVLSSSGIHSEWTGSAMAALIIFWLCSTLWTIISGAVISLKNAINLTRDGPRITTFAKLFSGYRSEIAQALEDVRTDEARMRILRLADAKSSEFSSRLRDPGNSWPSGLRPNYAPHVSSYLAILDERWWGLG